MGHVNGCCRAIIAAFQSLLSVGLDVRLGVEMILSICERKQKARCRPVPDVRFYLLSFELLSSVLYTHWKEALVVRASTQAFYDEVERRNYCNLRETSTEQSDIRRYLAIQWDNRTISKGIYNLCWSKARGGGRGAKGMRIAVYLCIWSAE